MLSSGYYYTQGFANLIDTGVLDPFSFTQTAAAMTALQGILRRRGAPLRRHLHHG